MRSIIIVLIAASLFVTSCRTQRAVFNYLEDVVDTSFKTDVYISEAVIQKSDLLSIQVFSAALPALADADALYNLPVSQQSTTTQNNQMGGYLVDVAGNITMPRIGEIRAEGLRKSELEDTIKARLNGLLTAPNVIVRFLNFRITVIGEVGAQAVLNIPTERLNVLEALGMVGGITQFGKIKEVKILRQNNGVTQLGILDLTSKSIFASPYFQLQQNDVLLVDQNRYKLRQTEQQRVAQQIGFATGLISTVALVIALIKR
ncbi:MAG TPA: polysaccharide biosynthesis/export family protein [Flavisolibacter sp.]|nr:polysaccharide biosynthesis/export family protein [Flavisolibacter sp.]